MKKRNLTLDFWVICKCYFFGVNLTHSRLLPRYVLRFGTDFRNVV